MIDIRDEAARHVPAREALLDTCFGPARFLKTCERLREGRRPAEGLALVAEAEGRLVGTVRLWPVTAGIARPALLLGPIAVEPSRQGIGLGQQLMRSALERAERHGHAAVLLIGDPGYYARFGFTPAPAGLGLPGPFERERFLALELTPGALDGAEGLVRPTGRPARRNGSWIGARPRRSAALPFAA